jgi:hypothetical protein
MNVIQVWNIGGMILTGEASPSASLSTTNPASIGLGSNRSVMVTGRRLTAAAKAWPSPADHKVFQFQPQYNMPTMGVSQGRMRACVWFVSCQTHCVTRYNMFVPGRELKFCWSYRHPNTRTLRYLETVRSITQWRRVTSLMNGNLGYTAAKTSNISTYLSLLRFEIETSCLSKFSGHFVHFWYFIYNDILKDSNTRSLNRMAATRSTFKSEPSWINAQIYTLFFTPSRLHPSITS